MKWVSQSESRELTVFGTKFVECEIEFRYRFDGCPTDEPAIIVEIDILKPVGFEDDDWTEWQFALLVTQEAYPTCKQFAGLWDTAESKIIDMIDTDFRKYVDLYLGEPDED